MATNRKLLNYLPQYMQSYTEMRELLEAEQSEIDALWSKVENAKSDQFLYEATENGISRWESMLGISPKGTDTLEERRFRILTQLNQDFPYTMTGLTRLLVNLCGEKGFQVVLNANEYTIEVKLGVANQNNYEEAVRLLQNMIPANLIPIVTIMYNAHSVFTGFTHAQMGAYTHNQLRNEVFD